MKKIEGRVGIVIAGSEITEEEQEIIDKANFKKRIFANGRFVICTSGERIVCSHLLNLSGREDIDKYYADILLDPKDYMSEPVKKKEKVKKAAPKKVEPKKVEAIKASPDKPL